MFVLSFDKKEKNDLFLFLAIQLVLDHSQLDTFDDSVQTSHSLFRLNRKLLLEMFDFGYALRLIGLGLKHWNRKPADLFAENIVRGRCWLNDLDTFRHMNNSRYLREADFGRISLLIQTGLWHSLRKQKNAYKQVGIVVSAIQVQYRRSVKLGDQFEIRTRLNGWDEKAFYIEQSMNLRKTNEDACLYLVRLSLTSKSVTPQMLVDSLQTGSVQSPPLSQNMINFKNNHRITFSLVPLKL